uniref:Uncharacterized protein n=1 Tax=Ciona intestinalis TaxID=7719 RepID=F6SK76_CIOIN
MVNLILSAIRQSSVRISVKLKQKQLFQIEAMKEELKCGLRLICS